MKTPNEDTIAAFEAKTHFARVLDRVEHGETITITRHGQIIARIVPVDDGDRSKARAAFERMKTHRRKLQKAPLGELLETIHEGHRYP